MSLAIATGITENYLARAKPLLASADKHGIDLDVFCVGFNPKDVLLGWPWVVPIPIDYSKVTPKPKSMLQDGGFTCFAPRNWLEDTAVAFIDADAVFQRGLTNSDFDLLCPEPGQVLVGRNKRHPGQTLMDEARGLFPRVAPDIILRRFPEADCMVCRNFGFVVARLTDWRRIYAGVEAEWKKVEETFANAAMVQWIGCYVVQRDLQLGPELPLSIHTHGHHGIPPGVEKRPDGISYYENEPILYAHCL